MLTTSLGAHSKHGTSSGTPSRLGVQHPALIDAPPTAHLEVTSLPGVTSHLKAFIKVEKYTLHCTLLTPKPAI